MQCIKILKCSDESKWYAGCVGYLLPYAGEDDGEYASREFAGYLNFVSKGDAELVEIDDSEVP